LRSFTVHAIAVFEGEVLFFLLWHQPGLFTK